MSRVVLVPGVLALLPEYSGLDDPVTELRAACLEAVGGLTDRVEIVADEQGRRVAEHLLAATGERGGDGTSYLVVGNGSACRSEKAPGHLDERAHAFDDAVEHALRTSDPGALAGIDQQLSRELWASTEGIARLGRILTPRHTATVDYADDPFGVQYWVVRWVADH